MVEGETATPDASLLPEVRVDVAVVDIGIPSDDGLDVCRDIRRRWQAPVVVVSAATDTDAVVAFLDAGVDDYLAWPVEPTVVTARLRAILRREPPRPERLSSEDRR
ncbi:MAG TPA: response regulator [Acidimicrobiales bacterium]